MTYRGCVYRVVHITYVRQEKAVVECLRDNHLLLSGYGHCDSPEYIAKYATYSLINSAPHKAPVYYAQFFTYYAFEQCSKMLPVKLNIMPLTTAIMPQFIYNFIIAMSILA